MIELLVLDVDGCLSDGKITYTNSGEELKSFSVKDGLGIASWIKMGKKVAIVTGRASKIVEKRAQELKIEHIYQNIKDKKTLLEKILKDEELEWKNIAAIGDDMNDIGVLKKAGWSFTPKDGTAFVQTQVKTILTKNGGDGAVREMIDTIIKIEGLEEEFLKLWL